MAGPSQVSPDFREPTAPADEQELDDAVQTILDALPAATVVTAIKAKTDNLPADPASATAVAALATTLTALAKVYQRQAPVAISQAALDTTEVILMEVGAAGGASAYRIDGGAFNISALGTNTVTLRIKLYVDVNGAAVALWTLDKTAVGAFVLADLLGALPPASRYLKVTAQRLTGLLSDGALVGTIEYSKAT